MADCDVSTVDGILSKYKTTGKQHTSLPLCCIYARHSDSRQRKHQHGRSATKTEGGVI